MGPHRRTSPRVRGSLAATELRARKRVEKEEFKNQVINLLKEILKLIKK